MPEKKFVDHKQWFHPKNIYCNPPYGENQKAKEAGFLFDGISKKWFISVKAHDETAEKALNYLIDNKLSCFYCKDQESKRFSSFATSKTEIKERFAKFNELRQSLKPKQQTIDVDFID